MKKIPICVYVSLHTYIEITIYICMYTLLIYSYICTAHILYGKSYTYKEIHNTGCTSTHIQTHVQNPKRNGYGLVVCAFLSRRPYVHPCAPSPSHTVMPHRRHTCSKALEGMSHKECVPSALWPLLRTGPFFI